MKPLKGQTIWEWALEFFSGDRNDLAEVKYETPGEPLDANAFPPWVWEQLGRRHAFFLDSKKPRPSGPSRVEEYDERYREVRDRQKLQVERDPEKYSRLDDSFGKPITESHAAQTASLYAVCKIEDTDREADGQG